MTKYAIFQKVERRALAAAYAAATVAAIPRGPNDADDKIAVNPAISDLPFIKANRAFNPPNIPTNILTEGRDKRVGEREHQRAGERTGAREDGRWVTRGGW